MFSNKKGWEASASVISMGKTRAYVISLPERTARAGAALVGGLVHETTSVLIPPGIRRSKLYQATVARLLRLIVELVGDVKGVYPAEQISAEDLLVRKTAGNVVELASFFAVGWSPIWLLAAAADLIGGTRLYLQALAQELKNAGILAQDTDVTSFEGLLTALEGTSGVLADTIDVPPLNVADMRAAWKELQRHTAELPSAERLAAIFASLQSAARHEGRSLLDISSIVALGAVRAGMQMGQTYLFEYYREALRTIAQEGLIAYLQRVSTPYLSRAVRHFDPRSTTFTERMLQRWSKRKHAQEDLIEQERIEGPQ